MACPFSFVEIPEIILSRGHLALVSYLFFFLIKKCVFFWMEGCQDSSPQ